MQLTTAHRVYFWAVGLFALWVGVWGTFAPTEVARAIPWAVPPLHARFIGALYGSAMLLLLGATRAKSVSEVRAIVPMATIWTGWLLIVSLLHLGEFNFARPPVWFWFFAYIVYPVVGAWLAWRYRNERRPAHATPLPAWVTGFVALLAIVFTLLAVLLFIAPAWMTTVWPWKIPAFLAQIYSGPFLALGVSAWVVARAATWEQARLFVWAITLLAVLVLVASLLHRGLFAAGSVSTIVWFVGFGLTAVVLGTASVKAALSRGRVA